MIALIALVLRWPPVVLAALPIGLYHGFKAVGGARPALAATLALIAVALGGAVIPLWGRSHTASDALF